jgi:hypothetical protein
VGRRNCHHIRSLIDGQSVGELVISYDK